MNERIKELYGKACEYGLSFTACNPNRTPEHFARAGQDLNEIIHEKFAELIVREVLDQVDEFSRLTKAYQTQGIDPEIDVTKEVLKNFGFTRFPRS